MAQVSCSWAGASLTCLWFLLVESWISKWLTLPKEHIHCKALSMPSASVLDQQDNVYDGKRQTSSLLLCYLPIGLFTALIVGTSPGKPGLKMRQIKVSYSSQVYSEQQVIYILGVKSSHWNIQPEGQATCDKTMVFHRSTWITATEVNSLLSATPGRSLHTHSKKKSVFWRNWGHKALLISYSFLESTQNFPHLTSFLDCVRHIFHISTTVVAGEPEA